MTHKGPIRYVIARGIKKPKMVTYGETTTGSAADRKRLVSLIESATRQGLSITFRPPKRGSL